MAEANQEKHEETFAAALEAVRAMSPADISARTGVRWLEKESRLVVEALGTTVALTWPALSFSPPEASEPSAGILRSFPWRLIALHYLAGAPGAEPAEEWISYRELPDGLFYANTITREVEEPLARLYARSPEAFVQAGRAAGATGVGLGEVGLLFFPLPRVPLIFALWPEDEEFPAKVKVLYERSGATNLPLQDLRILADLIGGVLKRGAPEQQ